MKFSRYPFLLILLSLLVLFIRPGVFSENDPWQVISEGLEFGRFNISSGSSKTDTVIYILKIDPEKFQINFYTIEEEGYPKGLPVKKWCANHGLIAAINAGMYLQDRSTHVGYFKANGKVLNPAVVKNDYHSAVAFNPLNDSLPRYYIHDLDITGLDSIVPYYNDVAQNLRLIKRPGENRWSQREKKWSEAALGEDTSGNILFIFCRTAFSMHDFNNILLSLPINIVTAQHLEGGPEAQLYIKYNDFEFEINGSHESGLIEANPGAFTFPIPNVIGIKARE